MGVKVAAQHSIVQQTHDNEDQRAIYCSSVSLTLFPLSTKGSSSNQEPVQCHVHARAQDDRGLLDFGDTADKDRASVRGRNTGGGGREGEANSSW